MYSDGRCQGVVIVMLCLSKNFELMQSETHIVVCETCLWMTWHRAFYNAEDAPAAWRVVTWHVPVFLQDALPGVSSRSILQRLYPYSLMLGKEGKTAVNDTLQVRLSCLVLFHVLPSFVMSCPVLSRLVQFCYVLSCLVHVLAWCSGTPDERRPWWWQSTLMRDHHDERPPWWETTVDDKRPSRWETTLMRGHPSFNSLLPYPITLGYIIGRWSTFGTVLFKLVMETCCRIMFGSRSAWWQIHCLTHNKKQTNKKHKNSRGIGGSNISSKLRPHFFSLPVMFPPKWNPSTHPFKDRFEL